jgi:hypothetical protein
LVVENHGWDSRYAYLACFFQIRIHRLARRLALKISFPAGKIQPDVSGAGLQYSGVSDVPGFHGMCPLHPVKHLPMGRHPSLKLGGFARQQAWHRGRIWEVTAAQQLNMNGLTVGVGSRGRPMAQYLFFTRLGASKHAGEGIRLRGERKGMVVNLDLRIILNHPPQSGRG